MSRRAWPAAAERLRCTAPTDQHQHATSGERILELVALLLLIAIAAAAFALAGPAAFTAVTSAGMGLFATW
ncbi:hypothetical protein [Streptomyces sp. TLI_171]|uniref:hypothetical protein n=1 Tax=Streptomyces sp. TLI_171 TaxID=1938859 RepID=UPI000C3BD674|nr:hypothetical protein [Streptomyces sp. TLI_171]RKE02965.1 hypothetical protein BX266_7569 [Streptomyces sp. TLI_171]